uniref:GAGE domain-containing protein n=1 Tax=Aotus nancymaae TaxID=37293 RepID=A0A2K5DYZ7_AOTNA
MSWQGRPTYRPRVLRYIQLSEVIGPMLHEQCNHEPPKEVEPPSQSLDPAPAQKRKDEGALAAQGPMLEADSQELVQLKTACECGDGPAVKRICLPNPEPGKLPEEGEGQSQC